MHRIVHKVFRLIPSCVILSLALSISVSARAQVQYAIRYQDSTQRSIQVSIDLTSDFQGPVQFIMPRSIPGGYGILPYDQCIRDIHAITAQGGRIGMQKDPNDAPRWVAAPVEGHPIRSIRYSVDLDRMERTFHAGDASLVRPGFAGILNYSVLGWVEGTETQQVSCTVSTYPSWPIFSSNQPTAEAAKGRLRINAENYFELADGQLFLGPRFRIKEFKGPVPLYIVSFCEPSDEYLDDYGLQGIASMEILQEYFGELPFRHYSILLRKALPLEPGSAPSLAMEHLQSATFFGDTTGMRVQPMHAETRRTTLPTYLHHMAHSFIPLRCYGDSYRPRVMEIPPIINNIWFNEGFMWFIVYDALRLERMKNGFRNSVFNAPPIIRDLGLLELSQAASTLYATDFRIGRAIYGRGALMAMDINEHLLQHSGGKKSMKDVYRYFWNWSKQYKRPFTLDEFPKLLNESCGIELSQIYEKWKGPVQ